MAISVECVLPHRSQLGEGAVWDVADGVLWWVDITAGHIHRFDPSTGGNKSWDFGEPVGCLARRDAGGLIVAARSGFHLFDPSTGRREPLAAPEADRPGNRFNDGATDNQGRFWAGTMKDDGGPPARVGQFYRFDPDRSVTPFFEKAYTPNGMTFSPDGRTMYLSDSNPAMRVIWACDYDPDTGTPSNQRVFFDTARMAGRPDGGTVDADGCYWMAGVDGAQVVRITPRGKVDRIIDMPVGKPTKPMFGGPGLDTLFVTSIGAGFDNDPSQPMAGGLFAITGLGVSGLSQARFAG